MNGAAGNPLTNTTTSSSTQRHNTPKSSSSSTLAAQTQQPRGRAHQQHHYAKWQLRKRLSTWLRQASQLHTAAGLAGKVPLIVGAIVVLLVVNTTLQYAAGPALQRALPTHGTSGSSGSSLHGGQAAAATEAGAAAGSLFSRHIPKGLVTDVVPGGADAELLCVDKLTACDKT